MRAPILTLFAAALFWSASSQAQEVRQNMEKQARDPKTAENAAKADVYLLRHKIVPDSSQAVAQPATKSKNKKCSPHTNKKQ